MKEKCVIYGLNRVTKDFLYIFAGRFEVTVIIDDEKKVEEWCEIPISDSGYLDRISPDEKIIVCGFDKRHAVETLETRGFRKDEDYFFEEEFFKDVDYYKVPDKPVVVWGTGINAKKLLTASPEFKISFFIDAKKAIKEFCGYEVKRPEEIDNWSDYFVIISFARDAEAIDYLEERGFVYPRDYINARVVYDSPSRLLKETIFDQKSYSFVCNSVLNHLEIVTDGNTAVCCTTFMEKGLDRLKNVSADRMWNSTMHKVLTLSTENRTYTFCIKDMCPFFIGRKNAVIDDSYIPSEKPYRQYEERPKVVALGYDSTCNLACETCRCEVHIAKGREKREAEELSDLIVSDGFLKDTEFLIAAGDGEVFLSHAYKRVYMNPVCNDIAYIRFLSNGTLFTPDRWNEFRKGKNGKVMLTVSVDAATKNTYEKIRRNGKFEELKKNMEFAAALKRSKDLSYFRMNFVVQQKNYLEMPAFVEWAKQLNCDEAFFTKILNWGTYSNEEFKKISMMEEDGKTPKPELKEILELPIMKDPIVDLGTIQYSHPGVQEKNIENYYMWEMHRKEPELFKNFFIDKTD